MSSSDIKVRVQNFGRFLSNMVMPNIGAFIAWGIITALFIPTGWTPNATLVKLVGPMITYLLPLLIGYTGGRMVGGERGGVVGAITTMGVIAGADMPMFLGSMIASPLGGWAIKRFDRAVDGKIKSGFEMLVNNFSAGIIGMLLAVLAFLAIGPLVEMLSKGLAAGVHLMVTYNMLPLTSIFVEPAKILFLNNAINHGIFSPLGIQQATETAKSILFLIEANPGPGMGVLMTYMIFGSGNAKQSAGGAAIIHFLGGIHEIYFPYVLNALETRYHAWVDQHVGFVDSAVDRIVPPVEAGSDDPLAVTVESFSEWIVDKTQFKGVPPALAGMELTDNLMAFVERKLFTLNTGHAITAYLGQLAGHQTIRYAILDPAVRQTVKGAMEESGAVLIKRYGFDAQKHAAYINKILQRFENPYLHDDVERVGRQPLRKLGAGDRLIKPLRGTLEYGLGHANLVTGIAAAMHYHSDQDPQAKEWAALLAEVGPQAALAKVSGLEEDSEVVAQVVNAFNAMQ